MAATQRPTEEDVFDLQIGLGQSCVAIEDRHFFDIAGYLELGKLLSPSQVQQARAQLQTARAEKDDQIEQWIHIIEAGGVLEDAMALASVQPYLQEFIWGNQYRLVGSRASVQPSRGQQRLKQGGRADKRRYARYRCTGEGQFRCLMMSLYIALEPLALGVVPGSHKAEFPHPYADIPLEQIPPLRWLELAPGAGVLFTESLAYAVGDYPSERRWLAYHYGPSYMVDWPGCEPSDSLLRRVATDPLKKHVLLAPYYHPEDAQKKQSR